MSSPFTFDEDNSSLRTREDDSTLVSFESNSSFADIGKDEVAIDQAIAGLKKCLQHYEDKGEFTICKFKNDTPLLTDSYGTQIRLNEKKS